MGAGALKLRAARRAPRALVGTYLWKGPGPRPSPMDDLALRGGALVLFLAVMAGGVYAAEEAFGDVGPGAGPSTGAGGVQLSSPEPSKSAAPGTSVTFPVVVRNGGAEAITVELGTPASSPLRAEVAPHNLTLAPGQQRGAFATVRLAPGQATGAARVVVQASSAGKALASLPLTLGVAVPAQAAKVGDQVNVDYVGRFTNGTLFDTSVRAVGEGPFEKPAGFRRDYQPLQVLLGPEAGTIEGFWKGIVGTGVGQSKTIALSPEEAYGNATLRQDVPRTTELQRLSQPLPRVQNFPRTILTQQLNASSKVGDLISLADPSGNNRTYLITALDTVNTSISWQVKQGDAFTIYPVWPGQSFAHVVTNDTVVFRTTPAQPAQALTFYAFWPNATRVQSMNETAIVIDTSPRVGSTFQLPQQGAGTARIADLTPTSIVVERPNSHPLAGQTLVFDLAVRDARTPLQPP